MRKPFLPAAVLAALALSPAASSLADEAALEATLYKTPWCGCCESYAEHLRHEGYAVKIEVTEGIEAVKRELGVPADLASCHTTVIDGYVIEGHVPFATLDKLLEERPALDGIALPGMPVGTPGMPGPKSGDFVVYGFDDEAVEVYNVE